MIFVCAHFLRQRHHHYHQYYLRHRHNRRHHITGLSIMYYSGELIYYIIYDIVIQHIINNTEQQTSKFIHHNYILLYYILWNQSSTVTPLGIITATGSCLRPCPVVLVLSSSLLEVTIIASKRSFRGMSCYVRSSPSLTVREFRSYTIVCTSSFSISVIVL